MDPVLTCANFVTDRNYFSAVKNKILALNLASTSYFTFGKFNSINQSKNNFRDLHWGYEWSQNPMYNKFLLSVCTRCNSNVKSFPQCSL
jgi:hypothetical protein